MKPKSTLRNSLALACSSILIVSSASAVTYVWDGTNVTGTPTAALDWFTGGPNTLGLWTGPVVPVSDPTTEIRFFANTTTALPNTAIPSTQTVNLNNGGSAFQLGTLTLNGLGSATSAASLTMTLQGDALNFSAATGTINFNSLKNVAPASDTLVHYNLNNNIQLGTASSGSVLTLTGNGDPGAIYNIGGTISELQAGGGSLVKSGTSAVTISGALTITGGVTVSAGTLTLSNNTNTASSMTVNGGTLNLTGSNITTTMTVNGGTLSLTGSNNTYTGGIILNGGTLSGSAAGLNSNLITVDGTANFALASAATTNSGITLNAASALTLQVNNNSFTVNGAVTGEGKLVVGIAGSGSSTYNLNSTTNTFTGGVDYTHSANAVGTLNVNSFADSATLGAGNIRFGLASGAGGSHVFGLGSGAITGLSLTNRQFEIAGTNTVGTVGINNNSSQTFTINSDLLASGTGNRTLSLGGTGAGLSTFAGDIGIGNLTTLNLTKAGTGTWVLSGANTYNGTTTISAGTLQLGAGSTTGNLSTSSVITINGGTFAINRSDAVAQGTDFSGAIISGVGGFAQIGAGTTTLNVANTFSGATTVTGGTLALTNNLAIQNSALSFTAGSQLDLSAATTPTIGGLNGSVNLALVTGYNSGVTALTLNPATGVTATYSGIISNGAATNLLLTKSGAGTQTLSGNNSFSGGLAINAGSLLLSGTQSFTGGVTLSGGNFGGTGLTNGITSAALNGNSIAVSGGNTASFYIESGQTLLAGSTITVNASGTLNIGLSNAGVATVNGVVSGSGLLDVSTRNTVAANYSNTTGVVNLVNTANTFSGNVQFTNSNGASGNHTLSVASIGDSGKVIAGAQGASNIPTFDLNAAATADLTFDTRQFQLIGTNANGLTISNSSARAFTINTNLDASLATTGAKSLNLAGAGTGLSSFNGIISNGGTTVSLTKSGSGTWALTNTANSYTGITTITAGTLQVSALADGGGNSSIGASSNAAANLVFGAPTATLRYTGASNVDIDRGFTMSSGTGGGATIESSGAGTLSFDNTVAINYGTASQTRLLTLGGTNTGDNTFGKVIANNTSLTSLTKAGTGKWVLTNTNTYTGATSVNGGTLQFQSGGSALTQTLGALAFAGADGTLESNKSGAGSITTNFNAFTARTTGNTGNIQSTGGTNGTDNIVNITGTAGFIDRGVFFGGSEFAARSATNGFVRALNYATIGGDTNTVDVNTITAARHVKLTSTPASQAAISLLSLNLSGSGVSWATTSGNLTVPGIIKSGGGSQSTISGGNLTTASNAELVIRTDTASDSLAISSNLTQGGGALTKSGAGILILSGSATSYTGQTYVNGGTLSIGANINIGAQATGATLNLRGGTLQATGTFGLFNGTAGTNNRAVVLTNAAGFDVTSSNTLTVAGVVSGTGSLTKTNTGTLTLSGTNTYTGATLVSAGTLFVSGSLVSDVTVSDTATIAGGGTVDDLILGGGSFFDLFLAVNSADSLAATNISFAAAGFGIDNLLANGAAVNWGTISNGTYTLITGTLNSTNLENFGLANAYDIGGGRTAYFQNGSLQLVVIPEPRAALLGCLGVLLLLRRRR
jgi:fibronectin-binding autotransporter adhesin